MAQHRHGNHNKRHFWMMVICCLVPLVALGLAWWLGASLGNAGLVALLLLCPLLHLVLMRDMGHHGAETPQPTEAAENYEMTSESGGDGHANKQS